MSRCVASLLSDQATAALQRPSARHDPRVCQWVHDVGRTNVDGLAGRAGTGIEKREGQRAVRCHTPCCRPETQSQNPTNSAAFMLANIEVIRTTRAAAPLPDTK